MSHSSSGNLMVHRVWPTPAAYALICKLNFFLIWEFVFFSFSSLSLCWGGGGLFFVRFVFLSSELRSFYSNQEQFVTALYHIPKILHQKYNQKIWRKHHPLHKRKYFTRSVDSTMLKSDWACLLGPGNKCEKAWECWASKYHDDYDGAEADTRWWRWGGREWDMNNSPSWRRSFHPEAEDWAPCRWWP